MAETQNSVTKLFISTVNELIDNGVIKGFNELAERLEWNKTSLSNVVNGRRNVPTDIYRKFTELYKTDTAVRVTDATNLVTTKILTIEAQQRVLLMALAELLAGSRGEPVAKVLSELEAAVNQQAESVIKRL